MAIITNTYTDEDKCKAYLALALFDLTTIDTQIALQAVNAKDKVNTFLGRTVDFTEAELMQTRFVGIVDSASQLTACFVQKNPQAAAANYTEDTVEECKYAFETLTQWALNNNIKIPNPEAPIAHVQTELIYITNDPSAGI